MPGPFPGMDPFLEDAAGWAGFRTRLVTAIGDALAAALTPRYHVHIEERVYLTDPDDDPGYATFVPDAILSRSPSDVEASTSTGARITAPVVISEFLDDEVHDPYLEIRDARSNQIVTAIEVLSPANKVSGSRGREALDAKRRQVLEAGASWLEIDLLRGGTRSARVAGRSDYCVLVLRPGRRGALAWLFGIRDPLPVVSVPLPLPDEGVAPDLALVVTGCYERGRYADTVDYGRAVPPPPLGIDDASWVQERVHAWRSRTDRE